MAESKKTAEVEHDLNIEYRKRHVEKRTIEEELQMLKRQIAFQRRETSRAVELERKLEDQKSHAEYMQHLKEDKQKSDRLTTSTQKSQSQIRDNAAV